MNLTDLSAYQLDELDAAIEAALCEKSLSAFFRAAWPYFDPAPFKPGRHFEAICEHLEAVSCGEIRKLIINVPPRHSKTSLVSIAWPVWTWCLPSSPTNPLVGPGVRFLCASYGSNKAEEDGKTARNLIGTEWISRTWGGRLQIGNRDNQQRYDTTAGGSRINTGIPESLGKGGIIRICFPYDEVIHTERGPMMIGDVVEQRAALNVPSYSKERNRIEMRPLVGWHTNPAADIYEMRFSDGTSVRATGNHLFRIADGSWRAVSDIRSGTPVEIVSLGDASGGVCPRAASANIPHGPFGQAKPYAKRLGCVGAANNCTSNFRSDLSGKSPRVRDLPLLATGGIIEHRNIGGNACPRSAASDLADCDFADPKSFSENRCWLKARYDRARNVSRDLRSGTFFQHRERPMPFSVSDVFGSGSVDQIFRDIVEAVSVKMAHLLPSGARAVKGERDQSVQFDVMGDSITAQRNAAISGRGNNAGTERFWLEHGDHGKIATFDDGAAFAPDVSKVGNFVGIEAGHIAPDLIYIVDVVHVGRSPLTYCVTVEENHTILVGRGSIKIAANCDDIHKTSEVESDAVRQSLIRSYEEIWQTRSNDPAKGAEVIVMQRLAHNDICGHLLDKYDDIVHLCLPARYDPQRHCRTSIGWEDWRTAMGEPLWPEMYSEAELDKKEREIGPHAWAGQFQQTPSPRGGGIVQREWWQPWPPAGEEDSWQRTYTDERGRDRVRQIMPDPEFVLVATDTAYTEKEENDWSACTVWSVFNHRSAPRVMLVEAWRDRLELRALCERLMDTCRRRQADMLLIENKASGPSIQQEIRRLMRDGEFSLKLENIKGDKSSRLHSVVPLFSGGVVYAPERKWADMVIDEVAAVPKGAHDDLADTVSLALNYLRKTGMARLTTEYERDVIDLATFKGQPGNSAVRRYGV